MYRIVYVNNNNERNRSPPSLYFFSRFRPKIENFAVTYTTTPATPPIFFPTCLLKIDGKMVLFSTCNTTATSNKLPNVFQNKIIIKKQPAE